jgi:hypothetical protein
MIQLIIEFPTATTIAHLATKQDWEAEKHRIMDNVKNDIMGYRNPVVWRELKRQRFHLTKTKRLFEAAPEAMDW